MVGSVRTVMKGSWRSASRVTAAVVLAICISENRPSCMRAPPLAVMHTKDDCSSMAVRTPRTNFSPTTEPIEPPMNSNSKQATTTGTVLMAPCMTISASVSPVSSLAPARRSG
jgi:hypothetical protein